MPGSHKYQLLLVLLINYAKGFSWNLFRHKLMLDGKCILLGNFIDKNTTDLFEGELLRDQVMLLRASVSDHFIIDLAYLRYTIPPFFGPNKYGLIDRKVFGLHAFIEDTIKSPTCAILIQGTKNGVEIKNYDTVCIV